jgi:hypothetical protein
MARIQNARRYLDGEITRPQAVQWLVEHTLQPRAFAERSVRFSDRYRSYVVNYGLGESMVRAWLAAHGGGDSNPARRWQLFERLLSVPMLPEDLLATP